MIRRSGKKIRFGKYKISEDVLRDSIIRVMNAKESKEDAEMAQTEPYVFSENFEKKMEEILRGETRKNKLRYPIRYVAATLVSVLLVSGLIFIGNEDARASKVSIEIQDWLDDFFLVENKAEKDNSADVLFSESQIGYLPDGFEKVFEEVFFSRVSYKYQNNAGDYIVLQVYRDKSTSGVDNNEIAQEVALNASGLEYRFIDTGDTKTNGIVWTDLDNKFYNLISTLSKEEIINIMDSISYQGA